MNEFYSPRRENKNTNETAYAEPADELNIVVDDNDTGAAFCSKCGNRLDAGDAFCSRRHRLRPRRLSSPRMFITTTITIQLPPPQIPPQTLTAAT